jgi:AcrR family transcriptional regulator
MAETGTHRAGKFPGNDAAKRTARTRRLVKEELIRVATQWFSERGYQNTTLDDIVSQVNISRVTFYTYFESKEALLKAIFERASATYQQGLEEILAQPLSCQEKLRQAVAFQVTSVTNGQPLARIFYREEASVPTDTAELVAATQQKADRLLEREMEQGIRSGEIINENPHLLMQAFRGMCTWLYRWYQPGGPIPSDDIVRVFTRVLESGLFVSQRRMDNGAVATSLRQVEKSLQEVQHEFKKVSQHLRLQAQRPRV